MTSFLSLPLPSPPPSAIKRKRVLLVDDCTAKRDLRAEAMRRLGVDVDCASDISEARSWWRADLYNLVLIDMDDRRQLDTFCEDLRAATPPQQLAFFVGKPEYLAQSPGAAAPGPDHQETTVPANGHSAIERTSEALRNLERPWGIMEASRRISAVRSVFAARSSALRNRPTPPRDVESRVSRHAETMAQLASELQKEELL
jgi:CheY-like chemotaxis protein